MKKTLTAATAAPKPELAPPARRPWPAAFGLCAALLGGLLSPPLLPRAHSAGGPVAVSVANPATAPALTRDVDSPTAQPVSFNTVVTSLGEAFFTVPAGKRLVITEIDGLSEHPSADFVAVATTTGGETNYVLTPFTAAAADGAQVAARSVNVIADPGTDLTVFLSATNGANPVSVYLSGYYVNVP